MAENGPSKKAQAKRSMIIILDTTVSLGAAKLQCHQNLHQRRITVGDEIITF